MKRTFLIAALIMLAVAGKAQVSQILGDWKTVDDKTGEKRSIVTIYKGSDGLYYGKVSKLLMYQELHPTCEACQGEDKNAPVEGLVIIRGMKAEDGQLVGLGHHPRHESRGRTTRRRQSARSREREVLLR